MSISEVGNIVHVFGSALNPVAKDASAMPAQSSENITAVEEAVFSSVAGTDKLHHKLASLSQKVLFSSIEFQPARKVLNLQQDTLKSKYIVLNTTRPDKTLAISASASSNKNSQTENEENDTSTMSGQRDGDGLPTPRYVIYPADKLCLDWWPRKVQKVGAGLHNLGNTCFLNATLQCLSYTPPLVNHLLGDEHTNSCKQVGFCMMCELQTHIRRSYENSGHAIKPQSILQKLKVIAKHMHFGRQEDAHEFLRYLVDALQKSCLNGYLKLDKYSRETTVINQIFGGFLRSQVQCMRCKEKSNTYDPYLDISLDIKNVPSLERAFEKYVTAEVLDHDNSYMCTRCQRKVVAEKRFTIHKPSNVLTIQLKRFDYNRYFGKIVRHISFPEKLNLRPYMSTRQGESLMYKLYAVLVHTGHSCTSGHYFAYIRPSNQSWYCMNDSSVTEVSASRVFESEAYMLFYLRCKEKKTTGNFIGPQMPALQTNFRVVNGSHRSPVLNDVGTALQRKNNTLQTLYSSKSLVDTGNSNTSKATPLPDKRDKISFGISSYAKADGTKSTSDRSSKTGDAKPRIVMQIKNGIVTTIEKPANGSIKVVNKHEEEVSKLVPYTGDSESDQENKSNSICSPPHVLKKSKSSSETYKHSDTKSDLSSSNDDKVVFDQSLNATTSVPGNAHLLETTNRERNNCRDIRSPDRFSLSSSLRHKDLTLKLHNRHSQSKCSPVEKCTSSSVSSTAVSVVAIAGVAQSLDTAATVKLKPSNLFVPSQESVTSLSSLASAPTSITSLNCATDWHVLDKGSISPSTKPEWQPAGWSVISKESLASNNNSSSSSCSSSSSSSNLLDETCLEVTGEAISKSISDSGIQATSGNSSLMMECSTSTTVSSNSVDLLPKENSNQQISTLSVKEEPKKIPPSANEIDIGKSSESVRSKSTIFNTSNVTNVVTSCPTPIVMTTPHNTLVNTNHVETSAVSGRHSHKKHKKHKRKRHKEENRHNRAEIEEEDLDGRSPRKKRHKKHKHKRELLFGDDRIEDPSPAQHFHEKDLKIDSSEYEWVERTKENFSSVDVSRNSLISSSQETVPESSKELLSKDHTGSQANQQISKEAVDSVLSLLQGPAEPPILPLPPLQRHTLKSQNIKPLRPIIEKGNGCVTEGLTWSTAEGSTKTSVNTVNDNPAKNKILNSNEKSLNYPVGCSSEKAVGSTANTVNRLSLPSSAQISCTRTDGHSKRHLIDIFSKSLDSCNQLFYHKNQSSSFMENRISKSSGRTVLSLAERENKSSGVNEKGAMLSAEPNRYSRANMESRHARQSVPSQRWDSHIHDGYKRPTKTPDNHKLYWDGSKSSRVGDELEKCSSRAYGGQVMSWDGGKSLLDQQLERERNRHERYMSHDFNDDYDRGKVKKIKKQRLNHMYKSGINNFQRLHNERNKEKWRYGQRMQSSPYSQNSYHRPYSHYGHHNQSMPYIGHYNHYMGRHSYRH